MTHLKIEQNNGITEEVSAETIEKLYNTVYNGQLDNTSNLIGRLHTSATYQDYIDYLEDAFKVNGVKLLVIDATKKYMRFADPEVTRVLVAQYGDGVGITATDVLFITSLPSSLFKNNTDIIQFNELSLLNVTSLPFECFYGSTNLSSIDTSKITTFEESSLRSIAATTINLSSATSLGDHLFEDNTALTSVTLDPNNVITYLGANAFNGCLNLEGSFDLSNSTITQIKQGVFSNCKKITSVTLPSTVTSIASFGFSNCSLLNSINLLNVATIGEEAFVNDTSLTTLDLSSLTLSRSRCFLGCTRLTSVTFNSSVKLADYTFNGCTGLTTITGTNKITSLGKGVFQNCSALTSIDLSSCTSIGNETFKNCSSLTTIDISSAESIGSYAFNQCSSLHSSISLLNCIFIANDAFRGSGITSFSALNLVTLQGGCFRECTSLLTVVLSNNLTDIGNYIFYGCSSLTSISLPNNLTSIKECAFYGCTNLTSISIPSTVTSLGNQCFRSSGLTSITIPSAVTEIGVDAFTSSLLTSITFEPNSQLTLLRGGCFNGCKFTTIDIPDSCTTMETNVFINMSTLTSIIIGTGIQSINKSFTNSSNYTLTIKATTPPSFVNTNCRKPIAIYVPSSSVSAYLSASGWSSWADVIRVIPT